MKANYNNIMDAVRAQLLSLLFGLGLRPDRIFVHFVDIVDIYTMKFNDFTVVNGGLPSSAYGNRRTSTSNFVVASLSCLTVIVHLRSQCMGHFRFAPRDTILYCHYKGFGEYIVAALA